MGGGDWLWNYETDEVVMGSCPELSGKGSEVVKGVVRNYRTRVVRL